MEWSKIDSELAQKEGWDLYHTNGSLDGDRQIQANDDAGILEDDNQAWGIVNKGTESHHFKAKEILKRDNINEYYRVINSN
jgi:hypothetical protein